MLDRLPMAVAELVLDRLAQTDRLAVRQVCSKCRAAVDSHLEHVATCLELRDPTDRGLDAFVVARRVSELKLATTSVHDADRFLRRCARLGAGAGLRRLDISVSDPLRRLPAHLLGAACWFRGLEALRLDLLGGVSSGDAAALPSCLTRLRRLREFGLLDRREGGPASRVLWRSLQHRMRSLESVDLAVGRSDFLDPGPGLDALKSLRYLADDTLAGRSLLGLGALRFVALQAPDRGGLLYGEFKVALERRLPESVRHLELAVSADFELSFACARVERLTLRAAAGTWADCYLPSRVAFDETRHCVTVRAEVLQLAERWAGLRALECVGDAETCLILEAGATGWAEWTEFSGRVDVDVRAGMLTVRVP